MKILRQLAVSNVNASRNKTIILSKRENGHGIKK